MSQTIKSTPVKDLGVDAINEMARRAGISATTLASKHVVSITEFPSGRVEDTSRAVTVVLLLDKAVDLKVQAVGVAIKSSEDVLYEDRGEAIALARAARALAR